MNRGATRRARHAQPAPDTRTTILRAAETVFERSGFTQTTIGEIAKAAGVSRPTVYAYFASKEDVFRSLAIAVRDEFLHGQEVDPDLPATEILRQTLAAYLDAWIRHQGLLAVINHQALIDPEMSQLWHDLHQWPNRRNARFIERLERDGTANPLVPATVLAEAITGTVRRFAELDSGSRAERTEMVDHLVTIYHRLAGM